MEPVPAKPIILYAEDDFDDFESIKEALHQLSDQPVLLHAKNGQEAVSFIENATVLPSLIVLDLNMPIMDGKEVLQWLKANDDYKNIPIMVFTTSSREDDVKLCQKHGCTFFRKPTLYRDLLHVAQAMLNLCEKSAV
ncbi:MAG: response regulator [Flavisolibacter sp.]|nr:response regulator [Flavisolibacter sp.]